PRMADFARWACAAADACGWTVEQFLDAYQSKREDTHALTLEASLVGPVVRAWVEAAKKWTGTASELLTSLEAYVQERLKHSETSTQSDVTKQKRWPKDGRALSNALRRLAPTLRALGIEVTFDDREPGGQRRRLIRLAQSMPQSQEQTEAPD